MAVKPIRIFFLILVVMLNVACSDPVADNISLLQQQNSVKLTTLGTQLSQGKVRNAMLLEQYAALVKQQRPELSQLLDQLALDATTQGQLYQNLSQRVTSSSDQTNFASPEELLGELENINQALEPTLFNDALSDPVNVIADMSENSLARVNSISQAQEQTANQSENFGPGSQLVGNPNYGSWSSGSGGSSFWQWYGMYAMFSNLTSGAIGYDRWGRYRGYSYYNDYGRYRYSSPKQRSQQQKTWNKTKKNFSTGQRYSTPYSKSRAGASSLSSRSVQAKSAAGSGFSGANKFQRKRSQSSYSNNSSFRNSRSTTSRGVRRGK